MASDARVDELSLCGLLKRLELIEHYKGIVRPSSEEQAVIETEGPVKKGIAEWLGVLQGFTADERKGATSFLQVQLKGVEPGTKAADARRAKLEELLSGVKAAPAAEEPAHVARARQQVKVAEKDFAEIYKDYEKWEKGKKMLSVDELNKLKRAHDDANKRIEAAKAYIEEQLCRRPEAAAALPKDLTGARPSAAMASSSSSSRPKAPTQRAAPPTKSAGPAGGYPSGPSSAAYRQACIVADVRAETARVEEGAARAPAAPPRPRPQAPRQIAEEVTEVVLSYSCTCQAAAEVLGISKDKAADLADSSKGFANHMTRDQWEQVQRRSVEIEKEQRERQKEIEKRRQDRALAKISGAAPSAVACATGKSSVPVGMLSPIPSKAPPAGVAKAKGKPAPAPAPKGPKKGVQSALATSNQFGGMADSDSD